MSGVAESVVVENAPSDCEKTVEFVKVNEKEVTDYLGNLVRD